MELMSLTELANLYGTDKGTIGPSQEWGANNYTPVYEKYLDKFRDNPITMLEIGLGVTGERWKSLIVHGRNSGGASIKMWQDYFSNGKIYGIDVNECSYLDNERVKTFVADQSNLEDLENFTKFSDNAQFDFVFDDGSHRPDHQQISLNYFFKHLKKKGIYIIEDLNFNGFGDNNEGRAICKDVLNTRHVLKHFLSHGEFPEPSALFDKDYLKQNISSIKFFNPHPTAGERLCVIHKV